MSLNLCIPLSTVYQSFHLSVVIVKLGVFLRLSVPLASVLEEKYIGVESLEFWLIVS